MNYIFLIPGYGIPKNILKDENYNIYLKTVFNKIYNLTVKHKISRPIIILNGGHTDCHKPYRRTEAGEMHKFLKNFIKSPVLQQITKDWVWLCEKKSISTLENLLYSQEIFSKKKMEVKTDLYIFCEQTKERVIKALVKKVFAKRYKTQVIPIDFDVSDNRYLDPKFIFEKEKRELKYAFWALKSAENLKKYRQIYKERLKFLRKAGTKKHVQAINKWWKIKLKELKK